MFSPARGAGARGAGVPSAADVEVSEEGLRQLLGMVDAERARMSKAVLSSADGLTAAVTVARKRLSASIAQVEEQRLLDAAPGPGAPLPETSKLGGSEVVMALEAQLAAKDSELEQQRADVRRLEEERDLYRAQAEETRRLANESRARHVMSKENNAALLSAVQTLQEHIKVKGVPLPNGYTSIRPEDHDTTSKNLLAPLSSVSGPTMADDQGGVYVEGVLRRKKAEHSRWEDPWRFKVQCRLVGFTLEMVSLDEARAASLPKEHFSMGEWYVPAERRINSAKSKGDALRFDLVHRVQGTVISLKADSIESCDRWVSSLQAVRARHVNGSNV